MQENTPPRSGRSTDALLNETTARLRLLRTLAADVNVATSIEELTERLRRASAAVLDFDVLTLSTYDASQDMLNFLGTYDDGQWTTFRPIAVSGTPSEYVIRERKPLLVNSSKDPAGRGARPFGKAALSESVIRVPMLQGDTVLGVLAIHSYTPNNYDLGDVEVFSGVAGVAAAALTAIGTAARLRESEARYRALFDSVPVGLFRTAPNGVINEANRVLAEIFGYDSAAQMIGMQFQQLYADPGECAAMLAMPLRGSVIRGHESRGVTRDGREILVRGTAHAARGDAGEIVGIEGTIEDVTEAKRASDELREKERSLATLFSNLPGFAYRCLNDPDWTIEFISDNCQKITGYRAEEFLDKTIVYADLIHPDDREHVWDRVQQALARSTPFQLEYRIITRSGEVRWAWEQGRRVATPEGELRLEGLILDITEKKLVEHNLQETEERYRQLVEQSPDVIALHNNGIIEYINASGARLAGAERPQELIGTPILDLVHPESRAGVLARVQQMLRTGEPAPVAEEKFLRRDGSTAIGEVSARPMKHLGENVIQVVVRDVTARHALEAQLAQSQRLEAVGRLAGGVAHDFNNILTAIRGHADFLVDWIGELEDGEGRDVAHQDALEVQRSAARAAALTRQLLAFSRRQVLKPEVLQLEQVVSEMHAMLTRIIGEDVDLRLDSEGAGCCVHVDRGQLEQVILNLVINARDAMPNGGVITVSLGERHLKTPLGDLLPGKYAALWVRDTGVGIAEHVLPHIFEPFFTTKETSGGSGLGLATVYGIVRQSSGHITVQSRLGAGSVFEVLLPLAEGDVRQREGGGDTQVSQYGRAETILLVEDEPAVRSMVERSLSRHGFNVISARNGGEALAIAGNSTYHIDLVLTDVVMPGIGGIEVADAVRGLLPNARIVLMSGYSDRAIELFGNLPQDVAFIEKPFSPAEIAQLVRNQLDGVPSR